MVELNQIPHIDEIAHHGVFHGAAEKKPATFQERSASQNKIVPSLEEAIRRTGLRYGMNFTLSTPNFWEEPDAGAVLAFGGPCAADRGHPQRRHYAH